MLYHFSSFTFITVTLTTLRSYRIERMYPALSLMYLLRFYPTSVAFLLLFSVATLVLRYHLLFFFRNL